MLPVFEAVFPLVAVAAFGYTLRCRAYLDEVETAAIERFTLSFLLPFLLFLGTATAALPETLDWRYLAAFYGAIALIYALGLLLGGLLFGYSPLQQSVFGMGGAYSNVTVVGVPVCLALLGEEAFPPMFLLIAVHQMFLFALGTLLAERGRERGATLLRHLGRVLRDLLGNPITGSLLAGGIYNLLGLGIWPPLHEAMRLLAQAAVPASLFILGASLTRYRVAGEWRPALLTVALKLAALPALVWLLMDRVAGVEPLWTATAVLLSAMPVGISTYVFARRYHCGEAQAAAAIVLSSLLSVATISVVVWWLGLS